MARVREYGLGRDGAPTDSRWTESTLYTTPEGEMIVHVNSFTAWQGEPCTQALHKVDAIQRGGRFEWLGRQAGLGWEGSQ